MANKYCCFSLLYFISFCLYSLTLFHQVALLYNYQDMSKNLFMEVMEQFSDQSKVKKLYKKAENMYLMKSYKIANVSWEESIGSYDRLLAKYNSGELKTNQNDWHKNERKLFIWFLICYCEEKRTPIQDLGEEEWEQMGYIFFNKSPLFLKFQGLSILKNTKRHVWVQQDDNLLRKFVQQINSKQWNSISKSIFFESEKGLFISAKQCRERWFNHICKSVNKLEWTHQQDVKILKMTLQIGKKWSQIARQLKTQRTQHMVKNRFNSIINKIRRKKLQNEIILTKKALNMLQQHEQKNQQSIEQQENVNKKQKMTISIIPKVEERQQTDIKSQADKKVQRQPEGQHYNLSQLPEGELKNFQNLLNKKQRGCFSFNPDESNALQNQQPFIFSMTPSVKAISPGFSSSFIASFGQFIRKQDGSGLISPAPKCYSPGPGGFFQSFSPGLQSFLANFDRQKNGLNSSRECIQFTPIPMQLSSELKQSMGYGNSKKQTKQAHE